jgi:hypothetical protein
LADFFQTGIFVGFSLHIINNAVRISEAAMGGAADIILIKKNKTKKVGRMVAPVYTLILTPNGPKKGLAPSKIPSE